jgi:hypothetical protein
MSRRIRITDGEAVTNGIGISVVFKSRENKVVNSKFSSVVLNEKANRIKIFVSIYIRIIPIE